MVDEKILERIRGLLAKSQVVTHEGATVAEALSNEAAAAAAKVAELLQKYNLTMGDVSTTPDAEMVEIGSDTYMARIDRWRLVLTQTVAHHLMCKVFYRKEYGLNRNTKKQTLQYRIYFYGRKANAEIAAYTLDTLYTRLLELAEARTSEYIAELKGIGIDPAHTNGLRFHHPVVFRNSWLLGAAEGVNSKMREQRQHAVQDSQIKAMVLVRDEEVEEAWALKSREMRTTRHNYSQGVRNDAYGEGYQTGKEMDVNPGLKKGG